MKLATYADGSRDGHLVVVSRDLTRAVFANDRATRLQHLLDDWNFVAPQLQELALTLDHGKARHAFPFDPANCMAPLPRLAHWAWQPVPPAVPRRGRAPRPQLQSAPGDDLRGPRAELALPEGRWPARVQAGIASITGELPLGAAPAQGLEAIRLLGLYLRWQMNPPQAGDDAADPADEAEGDAAAADLGLEGPAHWAPLLVTPDELGPAWIGGRVELDLALQWLSAAGKPLGAPLQAQGKAQRWHHGQILSWASRSRRLRQGAALGYDWLDAALPADLASATAHAARLELLGPDGFPVFGSLEPHWLQADAPLPRPQSAPPAVAAPEPDAGETEAVAAEAEQAPASPDAAPAPIEPVAVPARKRSRKARPKVEAAAAEPAETVDAGATEGTAENSAEGISDEPSASVDGTPAQ